MPTSTRSLLFAAALLSAVVVTSSTSADATSGMKHGKPDLKSAGTLAFGPEAVLFVADPQGAAIFALATDDRGPARAHGAVKVEKLDEKVAALLGTTSDKLLFNDMIVNPLSGSAYLSVSRGTGPNAQPILLKVDRESKLHALSLDGVLYSKVEIPDPPAPGAERRGRPLRVLAVTDMAYLNGRLLVAGLSNEEFASTLRSIPFPFKGAAEGTGIEIYHGAHGKFETHSPVRTFVPYGVAGQTYVFAAYTCTPLVKIPVTDLKPGTHVRGTTIAELGNRNRPFDMIVYKKEGKDYLLIANDRRGIMKLATDDFDDIEAITERVERGGTKGVPYETVSTWSGINQLDLFDDRQALVVRRDAESGGLTLETLALP